MQLAARPLDVQLSSAFFMIIPAGIEVIFVHFEVNSQHEWVRYVVYYAFGNYHFIRSVKGVLINYFLFFIIRGYYEKFTNNLFSMNGSETSIRGQCR